jgi:uncharacterized protein (UPF0548 family)
MFLARRPSHSVIERFLRESEALPLSYGPAGIIKDKPAGRGVVEQVFVIGHGLDDFKRAREALMTWKQFDIGWVELFPSRMPVAVGSVVAVLIRHFGFWSLNGCRVPYGLGNSVNECRFGYAHGTLLNHAECGEEIFEVFLDHGTLEVMYRICATSWPRAALARAGHPVVRLLQARFRRDSVAAMKRAIGRAKNGTL